jgi:hypothetical protein
MARTHIQLHDIDNVQVAAPVTNDVLTYNGVDWINAPTGASNRIYQRDTELAVHDVDGSPSNVTLTFDSNQIMIADGQQAIFSTNHDVWISYAF